ncbi:MAG TPA: IS1182 family transposase [Leptospiraceae bacterium]|nr:IS1182 family transposase [Leptospiraceae bacterium]
MDNLVLESSDKEKKQPRHSKVTYKKYEMSQDFLFPPSTSDYLPKNHIARLIHVIVDKMDIEYIESQYKGGGVSAYHPSMMLKVWLLGYVKKIYTNRKLEKALQENIAFMWISGRQTPDFKTLSNFRLSLKDDIKIIFKEVVLMGLEIGIIQGKDIFIDHTKIHASANPYKITWRKNIERRLSKVDEELEILFKHIDELNEREDAHYGDESISTVKESAFDKENIHSIVDKINNSLKEGRVTKEDAKKEKEVLKKTEKLLERKEKLENQKGILGERNSYSSTDNDATAMKMKRSEEIKPAYNEGIATENGFVVDYVISQNAADTVSFKELANGAIDNLGAKPENIIADAGYGSAENYDYLKEKEIENYVKYPSYHSENKMGDKFKLKDFTYDSANDSYQCLNHQALIFSHTSVRETKTGFQETVKIYHAKEASCGKCPIGAYCTTGKFRTLTVNPKLEEHKNIVRENLKSEKGIQLKKQRCFDVETVFANRKWNAANRRYLLRGKDKVNLEAGLVYLTHNIKKIFIYIMAKFDPFTPIESIII